MRMPTGEEVYQAIKESMMKVADLRLKQNSPAALYPREILSLLDEMARNASQSVIGMLPDDEEPNDIRIGGGVSIGSLRRGDDSELNLGLADILVMVASLQGRDYDDMRASRLARKIEDFYGTR